MSNHLTTTKSTSKPMIISKKKKSKQIDKFGIFEDLKKKGYDLLDHQKDGINWMLNRELKPKSANGSVFDIHGGLLCDDPGLGKTIQTCSSYSAMGKSYINYIT